MYHSLRLFTSSNSCWFFIKRQLALPDSTARPARWNNNLKHLQDELGKCWKLNLMMDLLNKNGWEKKTPTWRKSGTFVFSHCSVFREKQNTGINGAQPSADCASLKAAAAWLKVTRKILLHNLSHFSLKSLNLCQKSKRMEKLMEIWNFHSLNFNNQWLPGSSSHLPWVLSLVRTSRGRPSSGRVAGHGCNRYLCHVIWLLSYYVFFVAMKSAT